MIEVPESTPESANAVELEQSDIASRLEQQINERTHRRVQQLRVETVADRLVVHGRVNSRHIKQLALHAVGEVARFVTVELEILVMRPW
jgi:hypothetical protein